MSVIHHEDSLWPIAMILASGEPTLEHHLKSLEHWDEWFSRPTQFHVIRYFHDSDSLHNPKKVGKITREWMEKGAGQAIKDRVLSMHIIVPESDFPRMKKMSVQAAFGIPGGIVSSIDAALQALSQCANQQSKKPVNNVMAVRDFLQGFQ